MIKLLLSLIISCKKWSRSYFLGRSGPLFSGVAAFRATIIRIIGRRTGNIAESEYQRPTKGIALF